MNEVSLPYSTFVVSLQFWLSSLLVNSEAQIGSAFDSDGMQMAKLTQVTDATEPTHNQTTKSASENA
jgi:hypothetical protein